MRMIAVFEKGQRARYTSHLDMQRAVQRALRRANVPVKYSEGFNPHPVMSFASALSLGFTSKCECVDVAVEDMTEQAFFEAVSPVMPPALKLAGAYAVNDKYPALTGLLAEAEYAVALPLGDIKEEAELKAALDALLSRPVMAEKKGKAGVSEIDVRPMIKKTAVTVSDNSVCLHLLAECTAKGALNPNLLVPHLQRAWGVSAQPDICRTALLAAGGKPLWDAL